MAVSVLVVEDDRNIAELLQMYLEKEGYAVTVAEDGGKGLAGVVTKAEGYFNPFIEAMRGEAKA